MVIQRKSEDPEKLHCKHRLGIPPKVQGHFKKMIPKAKCQGLEDWNTEHEKVPFLEFCLLSTSINRFKSKDVLQSLVLVKWYKKEESMCHSLHSSCLNIKQRTKKL